MQDSERARHLKTLRELTRYLWPKNRPDLRARVVLAMASLAAAKGVNVIVPILLKRAVDSLAPQTAGVPIHYQIAIGFVIAYATARVLTLAFGELRDFLFEKVSQHTQRVVALSTFRHLHELSLSFHLDRQTGGLSQAIQRGKVGISRTLSFMLFNILPTLLEVFLVSVILFGNFGWSFMTVTLLTIAGYIVYTLLITDWRVKYRKDMNQRDSEANTKAIDSLLNFETVKYFGNEEHEYGRFDHALAAYETASVKSQTSLSLLNVGQGFIVGLGLIGVMSLAAYGVGQGSMTVGDFVLVNAYLIQLYMPLNMLGWVYRETKHSLVDMDKMFELLHVKRGVEDKPGACELVSKGGAIEFDQVEFGYDPERTILKGVSFKVPAGKTVAIVGPSGAGKSTISRLLFRFYDVTGGRITVDGQDVREVTQSSLRRAIGIVPQDTVLFNDTIGYNIQYGKPQATWGDVVKAARLARIEDFIRSLPKGFDSLVGERGLKLSGGEKQRVAIARTILKDPPILLFDEATSALDSQTEREIQSSLREVSSNRTALVIAHRLSTIVDADEILVLKDGKIIERGRHLDLLSFAGEYAQMWTKQAEVRSAEERLSALAD